MSRRSIDSIVNREYLTAAGRKCDTFACRSRWHAVYLAAANEFRMTVAPIFRVKRTY